MYQYNPRYIGITFFRNMKFILLCLFTFFLGYEYWKEAYIFGGYTITKALGLLYFVCALLSIKDSFSINEDNIKQLGSLFVLFVLFAVSNTSAHIFGSGKLSALLLLMPLQYLFLYWIVTNELRGKATKKKIVLIFFILGILSIYILAINGIGLQSSNDGDALESTENIKRLWFMGMNPNILGALSALASISLVYLLIDCDSKTTNYRYILL
ncbi:hypothetical protein, partial [Pseudoalteromonas sp. MelDa3]|uniref:hypothetical protein n=1 Tax=Pseudoalteromonas sp. MelDa3 TaxID=888435 RepID=UPI000CA9107D